MYIVIPRATTHKHTHTPHHTTHTHTQMKLRKSESEADSCTGSMSTIGRNNKGYIGSRDLSVLFITTECESTLISK